MQDNWGFVLAAYAVAGVLLAGYWRHLIRRERALNAPAAGRPPSARPAERP